MSLFCWDVIGGFYFTIVLLITPIGRILTQKYFPPISMVGKNFKNITLQHLTAMFVRKKEQDIEQKGAVFCNCRRLQF